APFGRDHVYYGRATQPADLAQRAFDVLDVVPVDRPGVFDAEVLEEGAGRDQLLQAFLDPAADFNRLIAGGHRAQDPVDAILGPVIGGVQNRQLLCQVLGQAADGQRVRPAVVVDDDDHRCFPVADVVQRFIGHAAGQSAVANYDHDMSSTALLSEGLGHPGGVAQPSGRMAVLDEVVLALPAVRVAAHAAQLSQPCETLARPREQLVDVGLVTGVPDDSVFGA